MPYLNDVLATDLNALEAAELDAMRREIIERSKGDYKSLSDEDLRLMAQITGMLRRRTVGPPKPAKAAKAAAKRKANINLAEEDFQ